MLLLTKEKGVRDDLPLKVTSEQHLDLSRRPHISRQQVRQPFPLGQRRVCDPVGKGIYTLAPGLKGRAFVLIRVIRVSLSFRCAFSDIVVFLRPVDLAPEFEIGRSSFESESLQALLEPVGLLLAEGDACPFKYSGL